MRGLLSTNLLLCICHISESNTARSERTREDKSGDFILQGCIFVLYERGSEGGSEAARERGRKGARDGGREGGREERDINTHTAGCVKAVPSPLTV